MSTQPSDLFEETDLDSTIDSELRLEPAIEDLLLRLRLRARLRIAWLHKLWRDEGASSGAALVNPAEVDSILADADSPLAEAQWLGANSQLAELHAHLTRLEQKMAADESSRWRLLCRIFALTPEDEDLLQACIGVQIDPSLARLYAYLQDHAARGHVTAELVRRLFGHGRKRLCQSESSLRLWNLISEREVAAGEPALFVADPGLCDWLMGSSSLDPLLVGKASIRQPLPPLRDWPVDATVESIERHVAGEDGTRIRILLSGTVGSGRHTLAAVIASRLGMPLLAIDSGELETAFWDLGFLHAQRQAFLDRTALCWSGTTALERSWPDRVVHFPVQFVVLEPGQNIAAHPGSIDHRIEMPALGVDERRELWQHYIPQSATWPEKDIGRLVAQHRITVGEIAGVADKKIDSFAEAEACVRQSARHRLGNLAQLVECPFGWDDLVLPQNVSEILRDFLFEAEDRNGFWEQDRARRLFPQGRGLMALLSGPSGTGKTMSAQVIAAQLGLDLFRIDLAAIVSKYVGETSQNLERILSRAQHMDVVLLFDEADALLGKRTEIKDAHDRFANTDTNYLLQALENYAGIAILSTNRKNNIDDAFLRRIRYVVEYPRPDAAQRLILWQRLIDELAASHTSANAEQQVPLSDLKLLASTVELTGAQIKYAVLAAVFAARREKTALGMKHLLRGIDRELMKEGRVLSQRERERFG